MKWRSVCRKGLEEYKGASGEPESASPIRGIRPSDVIKMLRRGPLTLRRLADALDRGRPTVDAVLVEMIERGYAIQRKLERVELPLIPPHPPPRPIIRTPQAVVRFGVTADTHFGSLWEQPPNLAAWVDEIYDEGIRHVLHGGDAVAGKNVYKGQLYENYCHSATSQVEAADARLPCKPGLFWYVLGGNHDYSFWRLSGLDPIAMLAARRDDIVRIGYDAADVPILPDMDARLWHPRKGPAYALSYHGQKYVEQLAFQELLKVVLGDKPTPSIRWLLVAHFHWMGLFLQGPIWLMHAGCWQGQTGYEMSKGLVPQIAGATVECKIRDSAVVDMVYHPRSYREIEEDYLNFPMPKATLTQREQVEPLFTYTGGDDG